MAKPRGFDYTNLTELSRFEPALLSSYSVRNKLLAEGAQKAALSTAQTNALVAAERRFADLHTSSVIKANASEMGRLATQTGKATMQMETFGARGPITMENFGAYTENAIKKVIVWQIAIMAVYGAIRRIGTTIDIWKDLELTLARIGITTQTTGEALYSYFSKTADIAVEFGMSISQTLQGMDLALRATAEYGNTAKRTEVAVSLLKDASILANLTGMQYGQSIDILVGALRQTGKNLDEGTAFLNKWVAVSKHAAASVNDMAQGFAIMADAATAAGLTVDQINGLLAALSEKVTLGPVEVGNALRALMSTVYNEGSIKLLTKFGVAVKDTSDNARDFWDLMNELSAMKAAGALDDAQWLAIARAAGGGARRYAQFLALLNAMPKAVQLADTSFNAQGDAIDANARIVNTLANTWDKFTASQQKFWMAGGARTGMIEELTDVIGSLAKMFDWFANMPSVILAMDKALIHLIVTLGAMQLAMKTIGWIGVGRAAQSMLGRASGISPQYIAGTSMANRMTAGLSPQAAGVLGIGNVAPQLAATAGMYSLMGLVPGFAATKQGLLSKLKEASFIPPTREVAAPLDMTDISKNLQSKLAAQQAATYTMIGQRGVSKGWLEKFKGSLATTPVFVKPPSVDIAMVNADLEEQAARNAIQAQAILKWQQQAKSVADLSKVSSPIWAATYATMPQLRYTKEVPPLPSGKIMPFSVQEKMAYMRAQMPPPYARPVAPMYPSQYPFTGRPFATYQQAAAMRLSGLPQLPRAVPVQTFQQQIGAMRVAAGLPLVTPTQMQPKVPIIGGMPIMPFTMDKLLTKLTTPWRAQWAQGSMAGKLVPSMGGAIGAIGMGAAAYGLTKDKATAIGTTIAGGIGAALAGPVGMVAGGAIGGVIGNVISNVFKSREERLTDEMASLSKRYKFDITEEAKKLIDEGLGLSDEAKEALAGEAPEYPSTMTRFTGMAFAPPDRYSGFKEKEAWEKGLGALEELNKAREKGIIDEVTYQKAIGETKINWQELSDTQKSYIAFLRILKNENDETARIAVEAAEKTIEISKIRADIDNDYINRQSRISDVMDELSLKAWEQAEINKLIVDSANRSSDAFSEERQALIGLGYSYASYIESVRTASKYVEGLTTISPDVFKELMIHAPEKIGELATISNEIASLTKASREFKELEFDEIFKLSGIEDTKASLSDISEALQKISEVSPSEEITKAQTKLNDQIERLNTLTNDYLLLPEKMAKYAQFKDYGAMSTIGTEEIGAWKQALPKLPAIEEWVGKTFPGADLKEETITLIDYMGNNVKTITSNTLALDLLRGIVEENTDALRGLEAEYNIPAGYSTPNSFWYKKMTGDLTFGPAEKTQWAQFEKYLEKLETELPNVLDKVINNTVAHVGELTLAQYELFAGPLGVKEQTGRTLGGHPVEDTWLEQFAASSTSSVQHLFDISNSSLRIESLLSSQSKVLNSILIALGGTPTALPIAAGNMGAKKPAVPTSMSS